MFYLQSVQDGKYLSVTPDMSRITYTDDKKKASIWYSTQQKECHSAYCKIQDTDHHIHLGVVHYPLKYITRLEGLFLIRDDIVCPVTTYHYIPDHVSVHNDKPLRIVHV